MTGLTVEAGGGISEGIVTGRIGVEAPIGAVTIVRFGCGNRDSRFSVTACDTGNSATFLSNSFMNSAADCVGKIKEGSVDGSVDGFVDRAVDG